MIRTFTGEILSAPAALEIDMNTCNYDCVYCYAKSLDRPKYFNLKSIVSMLRASQNGKRLIHRLIRTRYSICVCNRTDPFSSVNIKSTIPMIDILLSNGADPMYLTKGGAGIYDVLKLHEENKKKAVFYFTVTTINPEIARAIEPGAPPPEDRIAMIKDVIKAGHKVIVGINPLLDAWMSKAEVMEFTDRVSALGVSGFWVAGLHFGRNMTSDYATRAISAAARYGHTGFGKRQFDKARQMHVQDCVEAMIAKGYVVHCSLMPYTDDIYDIYSSVHKIMPVKTTIINHLIRGGKDQLLYFDEYYKITVGDEHRDLFETEFSFNDIQQYLFISGFRVSKQLDRSTVTLKGLLRFMWNVHDRMNKTPKDHILFLKCVDGGRPALDSSGNRIVFFSPDNIKYNRAGKVVYDIRAGKRTQEGKEVIL